MKYRKNILPAILGLMTFVSTDLSAQLFEYPVTRKTDQKDEYFGMTIEDPYRWLEDDRSAETAKWVEAQNAYTQSYLSKIPFRDKVKKRMTELWNFAKSSAPFKAGDNYFVYTNNGLQNQFVLNILRGGPNATPEVFIDPNTLSVDGTVNIGSLSASNDGKYLAYTLSKAGSDWQEIFVKQTSDGKQLNDKIEWVKFSGIAWKGNGFYYSRYDAPDAKNLLKGKNEFHKIYYHKLGDPQSADQLIFEDKEHPLRNFYAGVTDDERFLVISGSQGTSGNNLTVKDLSDPSSSFINLVEGFDDDFNVIDNEGSTLFVLTNANASRYKLATIDVKDGNRAWKDLIPESKNVLQQVNTASDKLVARYMKDATTEVLLFSRTGTPKGSIALSSIGTVDQMNSSKKDSRIFYALNTFTAPPAIYEYDLSTDTQKVFFKPEMKIHTDDFITEQQFITSKDGTKLPIFIVRKKEFTMNGNNPTLIFGYGGFNIPMTPQFKLERLVFIENGGVLVVPCLRGGGEYGEEWHQAGTKLRKQNVFDDCIATAEYLIKTNVTKPEKLAISGRSNGGLLAAAVALQRPDLFKVALPTVGVLDMLRYHKFTIGWAWKGDYGSSEDEANFRNLLRYSPLHNIRPNLRYPAFMVATGDHDDRVVPAHSFKFIATLQEKCKWPNPALIRIDVNSGHASTTFLGSSKPVAKQIEEQTDIFSFMMYNLGMNVE